MKILNEWLFKKWITLSRYQLDIEFRLRKDASDESMEYVKRNMKNALIFPIHKADVILNYGLSQIKNPGLILAFGVFKGRTTKIIAKKLSNRKIHGFDSFIGLPSDWAGHAHHKGTYDLNEKLPKVPSNVELHKGLFDKTLPNFVKEHNEKIAFIHVDCDIYSATKTIFDFLSGQIQKGTIIVFYEYISIINWKENEFKAFQEFVKQGNIIYKYLAVGGRSVCVEIT